MSEPANAQEQFKARTIEIRKTLAIFHQPGDVAEIRAIGARENKGRPHIRAGYFDDLDKAAERAAWMERLYKPDGIYLVLNKIDPALLARSANAMIPYPKVTTSDNDILGRRWMLIDVDPRRPSGISSTEAELKAACEMADQVRDYLCDEKGWDRPVEALSGNGKHLLFPIDMPNDEHSSQMVRNILGALHHKFTPGDAAVTIDTAVYKAAQLTKLYGTMARKGSDMPDRPHRRSKLLCVPEYLDVHLDEESEEVNDGESQDRSAA